MSVQPIYDFVIARLGETKGQWPQVAEASGVSKRTVEKIARKEISDPGVSHIQKLAEYFGYWDRRRENRKAA